MKVEIKILNKEFYSDRQLPSYATVGSAAIDLVCCKDVTVSPGETKAIPVGIAIWAGSSYYHGKIQKPDSSSLIEIAESIVTYAGLILPRSGLGTKGLILANTVGLIDADFQGEIVVQVYNRNPPEVAPFAWEDTHHENPFPDVNCIELKAGDRFAQLMFIPIVKPQWNVVEEFSSTTTRGTGSFGSTGA